MWNGEEFANVLLLMLMMLMMHYFVLFCLCVCALSHTSPYFTYELRNEGGGLSYALLVYLRLMWTWG